MCLVGWTVQLLYEAELLPTSRLWEQGEWQPVGAGRALAPASDLESSLCLLG